MTYKLSPSSLSLLKDCPRCFWLHHNKKIRRPDTIFPSLPSGMDRILKDHFDKFMRKGELPPELSKLKGYKLFDDEELLKIWRSNFKGIQWTDKKGNLFRGAVDNILVKGKKLVVLDYKTRGYPLKEDTHEHYIMQMDIYNFLLRKNGYSTADYTYLLFYHPQKVMASGNVVFNTDLIKIPTDPKRGEKIFRDAIKILQREEAPAPAKECDWCNFRELT